LDGFRDFKQTYVPQPEWFQYGAWSTLHNSVLNNEGVLDAYEPVPMQNKAIPNTSWYYKGEYYLTNEGSAKLLKWSPNEISFFINTPASNKLVINQNYDGNWKTREGLQAWSYQGLLSVDLKAGQNKVTFIYQPISFLIGCLFFMMALFATVFVLAKGKVCAIL
jgi:hypothetical protein